MISVTETIAESDYQLICDLVYQHSRIALGANKHELVSGRIKKRLRQLGLPDYSDYCRLLVSPDGSGELEALIDVISTNFTNFFRDPQHFDFLRREILPKLDLQDRARPHKFRVWSAACSSGEEPYSIACVLADFFPRAPRWSWEIEATDISTRMLEAAGRGIYELDKVRLPQADWLRRFFQRGHNRFAGYGRVKPEIRKAVQFHHLNLFQARYPFAAPFDVIFCRNVMIYFDRPSQQQLVLKLFQWLRPGGHLFVGPSESLIGISHPLRYVKPSIYRKEPKDSK